MFSQTKADRQDNTEVEIARCSRGHYFGELALVTNKPRAASAYAIGGVKCLGKFSKSIWLTFLHWNVHRALQQCHMTDVCVLVIDIQAFERLLGPCKEIMKRNIAHYEEQLVALFGSSVDLRGWDRLAVPYIYTHTRTHYTTRHMDYTLPKHFVGTHSFLCALILQPTHSLFQIILHTHTHTHMPDVIASAAQYEIETLPAQLLWPWTNHSLERTYTCAHTNTHIHLHQKFPAKDPSFLMVTCSHNKERKGDQIKDSMFKQEKSWYLSIK